MRYQLRGFLGSGGMGQVYRAHDPQLHRDVALKVLRGPSDEARRRALREARAQARVDHPNVCQIFDTGEDDGKAFIAMQLVQGKSLPEVAGDLDVRQKALLVRQVAEAVQAAHNSDLVHRDLKPANVLVELPDDGAPRPFVVDFGIARMGDGPRLTRTGDLPGTPAYLAPELLLGAGKADRRSDVYGLGAILYELLRGQAPYDGETSMEILAQVVQRPPPSLRAARPDLPRDLCWIVEQAMDREPGRRYASARLMAEDLDRFLRGEPVLARPPSLGYRFSLWLVRNRGLAVLALVAVVAGLAGGVRYTLDLRQERRAAEAARDEAEDVSSFLVEIFRSADPRQNRGDVPTVRQVLDQASRRLEAELEPGSETRIRLDGILADVYAELGDYDTAEVHAEAAVRAAGGRWGEDSPRIASTLDHLANVRRLQGRIDEAEELWQRSLRLRRQAGLGIAAPLIGLGGQAAEASEFARSRDLLSQALESLDASDRSSRVSALFELARTEREAGNLERAEEHFRQALDALGSSDPLKRALILNNLGMLLHDRGELDPAQGRFEQALDIRRRILGDVHPSVASSLNNLGRSARQAGRYSLAEQAYSEVLRIYEQTLEPDHYWVGIILNNLGRLHRDLGQYEQARDELRRGLEILRATVGDQQPRTHFAVYNLALVDLDQGRYAAAGEGFLAVRSALEELVGPRHSYVAVALEGVGRWQLRTGAFGAAEASLRQALAIFLDTSGAEDLRTQRCLLRLSRALSALGRKDAALEIARDSVDRLRQEIGGDPAGWPADSKRRAVALLAQAHALFAELADPTSAQAEARQGLELLDACCRQVTSVEWRELRARLLDLAGRGEAAATVRRELQQTGYVPVAFDQAETFPDSKPSAKIGVSVSSLPASQPRPWSRISESWSMPRGSAPQRSMAGESGRRWTSRPARSTKPGSGVTTTVDACGNGPPGSSSVRTAQ